MKPHVKVPPPPSLPQGLIALVSPLPRRAAPSPAEQSAVAEPIEATRAWKPNRDLLQTDPQPEGLSDFANAADEPTMVGAINLSNPSLFRSAPPPPPAEDADLEDAADDDGSTVEFVGVLATLDRDEGEPTAASIGGEEVTKLYRPERARLEPEETTDEFEAVGAAEDARPLGPAPPKVIIAPAVLADAGPDPSRGEATKKKKRRALPGNESKLGLGMCLLGGLALALSVAWRHPKTAPVAHDALARVATVATKMFGR